MPKHSKTVGNRGICPRKFSQGLVNNFPAIAQMGFEANWKCSVWREKWLD
jgi:hypothetical protein